MLPTPLLDIVADYAEMPRVIAWIASEPSALRTFLLPLDTRLRRRRAVGILIDLMRLRGDFAVRILCKRMAGVPSACLARVIRTACVYGGSAGVLALRMLPIKVKQIRANNCYVIHLAAEHNNADIMEYLAARFGLGPPDVRLDPVRFRRMISRAIVGGRADALRSLRVTYGVTANDLDSLVSRAILVADKHPQIIQMFCCEFGVTPQCIRQCARQPHQGYSTSKAEILIDRLLRAVYH